MQIKSVKWVEIHDQYKYDGTSHDVAIMRLEFQKATTTVKGGLTHKKHYVEPACLPLNLPTIGKFDTLGHGLMWSINDEATRIFRI